MAKEEHVDLLRESVRLWNMERAEYSETKRRFAEADRVGGDLIEADFSAPDLAGVNLAGVNLSRANLRRVNLSGARLTGADLTGARLWEANLSGADLTEARLYETIFANVNLTKTIGLDSCIHSGPSTIDHRTMQYGLLPLAFPRGCGLSDWEIEAAKLHQEGLTPTQVTDIAYKLVELRGGSPIQFYSCFISYSATDEAFVKELYDDLQESGVRCWFAPKDLKIGEKFRPRIDEAIYLQDRLLLVLSRSSLSSPWVEKEVETAFEKENKQERTVLFPLRVDDAVMDSQFGWAADIRRSRHIGDFTRWKKRATYQQAFARLLRDLQTVPAPAEAPTKPQH